jgi:hypothetical protein
MTKDLEFPEYSYVYSKKAKQLRQSLPASLRPILDELEYELVENPDQYPARTISLSEDIYIYKHPHPHIEMTYKIDREKKIIYFLHLVTPFLEISKPLFISYSHKDEEWLIELKKWLSPLEKKDLIKIWDDKKLKAGDIWRDEIEKALNSAKAAVLLISQDFLNSEFISNIELPSLLKAAEERGVKIFWIAVRPSTVDDSYIAKYQAVHKDPPLNELDPNEREKEYLRIYKSIKDILN